MSALPEYICKRHANATDSCNVSTEDCTHAAGNQATIEISINYRAESFTAFCYLGTRLSICTWIDKERENWKEKQAAKHPSQCGTAVVL